MKHLPYGTWPSPITAAWVAKNKRGEFNHIKSSKGAVCWLESRPEEKGRTVIMRRKDNVTREITPAPFNVRTRVHEYGGGEYWLHGDTVYFVHDADQRIYQQKNGEAPHAITPEPEEKHAVRYADGVVTENGEWLICVRERHTNTIIPQTNHEPHDPNPVTPQLREPVTPQLREPVIPRLREPVIPRLDRGIHKKVINDLITIHLPTKKITVIAEGADFYSSPRLSKDNTQLAFITWHHPNMPWDCTALWLGEFDATTGTLKNKRHIAGGDTESICQPSWHHNTLHFISDKTNWWNVYRFENNTTKNLTPIEKDCAYPHWIFGTSTYAFLNDGSLACIAYHQGRNELVHIQNNGDIKNLDVPFDTFNCFLAENDDSLIFSASNALTPATLIEYDTRLQQYNIIDAKRCDINLAYFSRPETISYDTDDNAISHAFYYPPQNKDISGEPNTLPPLLVLSHGGPTAATNAAFNPQIQFWTSRGFAVVDVNYRGSTGYGRTYRDSLKNNWGVADVADCVNAAKALIETNRVDPKKIAIRGGSAGGYTTLCALTYYNLFTAGASYYGVSDLKMLTDDTHKFEARYLDSLIGPYPQEKQIYHDRSPINFTERLTCPIIFLQGLEDKVVPPSQAEDMIEAMKKNNIPYEYVTFEHEQHGFRDAKNIEKALDSEYAFYLKTWG